MKWLSDELMFYGGAVLAAVAFVIGIVYLIAAKRSARRLHGQLDEEYGKKATSPGNYGSEREG